MDGNALPRLVLVRPGMLALLLVTGRGSFIKVVGHGELIKVGMKGCVAIPFYVSVLLR